MVWFMGIDIGSGTSKGVITKDGKEYICDAMQTFNEFYYLRDHGTLKGKKTIGHLWWKKEVDNIERTYHIKRYIRAEDIKEIVVERI